MIRLFYIIKLSILQAPNGHGSSDLSHICAFEFFLALYVALVLLLYLILFNPVEPPSGYLSQYKISWNP